MLLVIIKTLDGYMVEDTEEGQYIEDFYGNNLFETLEEAEEIMSIHLMEYGTDIENGMI